MSDHLEPTMEIAVDPTNPGQFFGCCGLFALADRLWPGIEACFSADDRRFCFFRAGTLAELIAKVADAPLRPTRPDDPYSSPVVIGGEFQEVSIDWWETDQTGAKDLKVWAGTMESFGIALAMQRAMRDERFRTPRLFDLGMVVTNPNDPKKKKEPYYFDARRAPNAHSRDIGFSPNDLHLTTVAYPAVELLCLIGLQFARPSNLVGSRVYEYSTWRWPLTTNLMLGISSGSFPMPGEQRYRFENWFRTGQRKHKAFRAATPLSMQGA